MINVTVIGFGYVGSSLSWLLLNNARPFRLNIMEPSPECEGAFLDLAHGVPLYRDKELHINQEDLFLQAEFIFYAAGIPNKHGSSRLSTAKQNIQLSKEIFQHRIFVNNPFIIAITNPVDLIAQSVFRFSGLAAERVVGIGTYLDSVRLAYYLSTESEFQVTDFEAMVVGEHGDSQVPIYSNCKLKGNSILGHPAFSNDLLERVGVLTKNAAFQIRETQQGTTYGVSKCAEALLEFLLGSTERSLTLSVLTNEHYRALLQLEKDMYIGIPVRIKHGQIIINDQVSFSEEELNAYRKSAATLADMMEQHF